MENPINSKITNSFSIENILAKKPILRENEDCDFINNRNGDRELFDNKISACVENYRLDKNFSMADSSCTEDINECSDEASEESNCKSMIEGAISYNLLRSMAKKNKSLADENLRIIKINF